MPWYDVACQRILRGIGERVDNSPPASSVGSCQIEEHRNVIDSEKQAANTSSNIESVALSVDNAE